MSQQEAGLFFSLPPSTGAHDGGVSFPVVMRDTRADPGLGQPGEGLVLILWAVG